MVVTTRTLTWMGIIITLISAVTLGIIVLNAPPTPPLIALFIGYLGLTTFGLFTTGHALIQHLRGRTQPHGILRRSVIAGITVIILVVLQYQGLLVLPLSLVILLMAIVIEITIYLYLRRRAQVTTSSSASRGSTSHTVSSHTRKGPKKRTKS